MAGPCRILASTGLSPLSSLVGAVETPSHPARRWRVRKDLAMSRLFVRTGVALSLAVLAFAVPLTAQPTYTFRQTRGISIEILSRDAFAARFGQNPDVPRTDDEVLDLALRLYPPLWQRAVQAPAAPAPRGEECGEAANGALFAALSNPDITDATRRQVDAILAAAKPPLPKTITLGHFAFAYTDNDPDPNHNVTLLQVRQLASRLNASWARLSSAFRVPQHYVSGKKALIDIEIWDFSAERGGETDSHWNFIRVNSRLAFTTDCVLSDVAQHEMFHRVQYAYGYVSGTAKMKWMVEGTASWSEHFQNAASRAYMSWMNEALEFPDVDLLADRSYDAVLLWVYVEKRAKVSAIKEAWMAYATSLTGMAAFDTAMMKTLRMSGSDFLQEWIKANYIKDLQRPGLYEYLEDELVRANCTTTYGPLSHVPRTPGELLPGSNWVQTGRVAAYGADYFEFDVAPSMTRIRIDVRGEGDGLLNDYTYHFLGIKTNRVRLLESTQDTNHTFERTIAPGAWDKVAVIVGGGAIGGGYALGVGDPLLPGIWDISEYYSWQGQSFQAVWTVAAVDAAFTVEAQRPGGDSVWGQGHVVNLYTFIVDHAGYGSGNPVNINACSGGGVYQYGGAMDAIDKTLEGYVQFSCTAEGWWITGTFTATKR